MLQIWVRVYLVHLSSQLRYPDLRNRAPVEDFYFAALAGWGASDVRDGIRGGGVTRRLCLFWYSPVDCIKGGSTAPSPGIAGYYLWLVMIYQFLRFWENPFFAWMVCTPAPESRLRWGGQRLNRSSPTVWTSWENIKQIFIWFYFRSLGTAHVVCDPCDPSLGLLYCARSKDRNSSEDTDVKCMKDFQSCDVHTRHYCPIYNWQYILVH